MRRSLLAFAALALLALPAGARAADDAYTKARDAFLSGDNGEVVKLLPPATLAKLRNRTHAALWVAIAQARDGHKDDALDGLKAYRAKNKESAFIDRVADVFLGKATENAVLDTAKEPWQKCEAGFYLGAYRKYFDVDLGRSKELLQTSVESGQTSFSEYRMAEALLGVKEEQAAAPPGVATTVAHPHTAGTLEAAMRADSLGEKETAIAEYREALKNVRDTELGGMVRSRIYALSREVYEQRASDAVKQEATLSKAPASENAVAVTRFENLSTDDETGPLEKGIPAMLSSDLAQVKKLTVLERVELESVMDELKLSHTEMFDAKTAPRLGRLVRAGRVVVGSYKRGEPDKLDLDARVIDARDGKVQGTAHASGKLRDFFTMEKTLVFALLDKMDVHPTTVERNTIERQVPTKELAAFLAYSRGLDEEDRGNYGKAAADYDEATTKDPNFREARAAGQLTARGSVSFGDLAKRVRAGAQAPSPTHVAAKTQNSRLEERLFENERLTGSGLIPDLGDAGTPDRTITRPGQSGTATIIISGRVPR